MAALAAGGHDRGRAPSPRSVLRAFYVAPGSLPLDPQLEDVFVASMNSTRTGVDHYPGEPVTVEAWPGVAPGPARGAQHDGADGVRRLRHRRPRREAAGALDPGDADQIVSDTSVFDLAFLGSVGAVPGRGRTPCPPQPMVTQTRTVLDRYAATGGAYREVVLPDVGHSPHVERPQEFAVALLEHLDVPAEAPANLR